MIRVLLDTDHMSLHERGHLPLRARLASFPPEEVAVSIVTVEEMLRGRLAILARRSAGEARVHAYLNDIERAAESISAGRYSDTSLSGGSEEGFMLAALTFLEKHKDRFPDTYKRAQESYARATEQKEGEFSSTIRDRLNRGADTMRALLRGIAAGHRSRTGN